MFNVLPDIFKKDIIYEYKLRLAIVFCLIIIFIEVSFLIFLVPTWVNSVYKDKEVTMVMTSLNQSLLSKNMKTITDVILSTNAKLKILQNNLTYSEVFPLFNTVLNKKSAAIHISDFSYSSFGTSSARIVVGGVSNTRESLVSFVRELQNSKQFTTVDLPVSNLAMDKDLDFNLTLTLGQ